VNRSQNDRTLLVEHPYRPVFHLANDLKPAERTRNLYRFEVKVPAGKTGDLEVTEERDLVQTVQLTNSDEQQVRFFLQQQVLSPAVRQALEKAVGMRGELAVVQRELEQANRALAQIEQDQTRLRANLKEMPPTAAAYKRYLDKFDQQETQIEQLQAKRQQLQDQEHLKRQGYETYLMSLNVE
jgi:septal ring factor EnvC (AmiA/AmiB activator)